MIQGESTKTESNWVSLWDGAGTATASSLKYWTARQHTLKMLQLLFAGSAPALSGFVRAGTAGPLPVQADGPFPARMPATLPGVASTAPYSYFSGFLNAGTPPSGRGEMYFHYICAMAPDWQNMPLTIWYNGGPGAPSTFGLFQEFGPFLLTSDSFRTEAYQSSGIPTPLYNPWTWANVTSLCEIDSPPPMGASFCTMGNGSAGSIGGPAGDAYSCGPWSDRTVAAANHKAHRAFFTQAFPEFEASQQPVSFFGESYAGID